MLANYPDVAHVHEHNEEIGREVRTNRLESRLREGGDRHLLKRGVVVLTLALGAALVAVTALTSVVPMAEAAPTPEKIVFSSDRAVGPGVDNPTRDYEIFKMNPDGTGVRQLTFNKTDDYEPILAPDGTRIAFTHRSVQVTEQGGFEIWVLNAKDGSGTKNLTANGSSVDDYSPAFSPGSKRITYTSFGEQTSNPEGDNEIYLMSAVDGSGKKNLTDNGVEVAGASPVEDYGSIFSPDGTRISYVSNGEQTSNPEGDSEVYVMNTSDGSGQKNLTYNGADVEDFYPAFSPDGQWISYTSRGEQTSNPEGDWEVYRMNALDGAGQTNLSNNGLDVYDGKPVFSPGGARIVYESSGKQPSNADGDGEIYRMNAQDGMGQVNLSNNGAGVNESYADFSANGTKIFYQTYGKQTSNPEGDFEMYRMDTGDGSGKKNLTDNRVAQDGTNPGS